MYYNNLPFVNNIHTFVTQLKSHLQVFQRSRLNTKYIFFISTDLVEAIKFRLNFFQFQKTLVKIQLVLHNIRLVVHATYIYCTYKQKSLLHTKRKNKSYQNDSFDRFLLFLFYILNYQDVCTLIFFQAVLIIISLPNFFYFFSPNRTLNRTYISTFIQFITISRLFQVPASISSIYVNVQNILLVLAMGVCWGVHSAI